MQGLPAALQHRDHRHTAQVLLEARRRGLQAADPRPSHVHGRQVTVEPGEVQAPDTQGWVLGGEVSAGGGELNIETRSGSVLE